MRAGRRTFDPACRRCPRLVAYLDQVRRVHPDYHCAPVAPFGRLGEPLLVVGLAPGLRGANRTGRPFTGDHAGILLYHTLHAHGFATRAESVARGDGLRLIGCRITNAVKCLPPGNAPTTDEIVRCNDYLAAELARVPQGGVVLALGGKAHEAILRALGLRVGALPFDHGTLHALPQGRRLLDSYHTSRRNMNRGLLTTAMFDRIVARARHLLAG